MRNAFAISLEPLASLGDGLLLLFRLRFIVDGSVAESRVDRIDDRFKQSDQRRELRFRQGIDQLVRVLAILTHASILTYLRTNPGRRSSFVVHTEKGERIPWIT